MTHKYFEIIKEEIKIRSIYESENNNKMKCFITNRMIAYNNLAYNLGIISFNTWKIILKRYY